ncbi:MAG: hypothetical protein IPK82_08090 [Polyangiaceae bacterium]|nr:hypothetical protein [Polyangiaceae bacterium]
MRICAFPKLKMAFLASVIVGSASAPAAANGRYPAAGLIVLDPSDPKHIVVRATYGLITTADGGDTWKWVCEQSVGFSDNEDPMVAITQNGTLLAGVFNGLSVSTDRGCNWSFVGGDLTDRFVVDLSTEKQAPQNAVAIASNGIGGGKFLTQVFESKDNGVNWSQLGADLSEDVLGLSIDVAPSNDQVVYITGRAAAPTYTGVLLRSKDRGASWETFEIPGANDTHPPYLSAIDPTNPEVVYVRLDAGEADQLVVSTDGGQNWTNVFEKTGGLLGFALSPDGKKVAIGGDKDGLWTAPTDTFAFTKVADLRVKCLLWTDQVMYACADEFKDGFHIGVSENEGKTFIPFEHLNEICELECPQGTTTRLECPKQWGAVALTIDAKSCGAGASGGAGGTGGTGGSGATGGGGGCSCELSSEVAGGGAAWLGALALLGLLRRKKNARR